MAVVSADPAYAQSADTAIDDAIIVTAQRRQERTQDVPISITSIGADALQQANVNQLGDIAKLSPATRFDYNSNFVQPTIRGIGTAVVTSGGGANVGIYTDGFYSPNPLAADFQLLSVESIQVLKGPQGTLFGRNTTGGAILVTTSQPSQDLRSIMEMSYGRFNTARAQAYVSGGLSEAIAVDLEGSYARSDGYVRNLAAGGDPDIGGYNNWSIRAGLKLDVSDRVSFLARYLHQDVNDGSNTATGVLVQDGVTYSNSNVRPPATPRTSSQMATRKSLSMSLSGPAVLDGGYLLLQIQGHIRQRPSQRSRFTLLYICGIIVDYREHRGLYRCHVSDSGQTLPHRRRAIQPRPVRECQPVSTGCGQYLSACDQERQDHAADRPAL